MTSRTPPLLGCQGHGIPLGGQQANHHGTPDLQALIILGGKAGCKGWEKRWGFPEMEVNTFIYFFSSGLLGLTSRLAN